MRIKSQMSIIIQSSWCNDTGKMISILIMNIDQEKKAHAITASIFSFIYVQIEPSIFAGWQQVCVQTIIFQIGAFFFFVARSFNDRRISFSSFELSVWIKGNINYLPYTIFALKHGQRPNQQKQNLNAQQYSIYKEINEMRLRCSLQFASVWASVDRQHR